MFRMFCMNAAVVSAVVLAGCDNAADQQAKAQKAQNEANQKTQAAVDEANTKIAEAQAQADNTTAQVRANLDQMREDYRHKVHTQLVDLDERIAKLEAKEKVAVGKDKQDLDAELERIRAQRAMFDRDVQALETATAQTWDATKAKVDRDLADLRALIGKS